MTTTQENGDFGGSDKLINPLAGIAQRFVDFCKRFASPFDSQTRTRETQVKQYHRYLIPSEKANMERMAEVVPEADAQ